jgi:selenium metabolism protein YedF
MLVAMTTAIIINGETLGRGSDDLGQTLMGNFLRKLWASPAKPQVVAFYNSGVKLLMVGSPVLDALDGLAHAGVELIACGTCVKYFGLEDRLGTGRISDMQEIVGKLMASDKVITV